MLVPTHQQEPSGRQSKLQQQLGALHPGEGYRIDPVKEPGDPYPEPQSVLVDPTGAARKLVW